MKKILLILVLTLFLVGCATVSISDIKSDPNSYVGEKVNVQGTASDSLKLGKISGFKLHDGDESLLISSEELPKNGEKVSVRGTVMKDTLLGVYILADTVN
jgi:uncharacterized protein YxeA